MKKKIAAVILSLAVIMAYMPVYAAEINDPESSWDCIYYGIYPQTEIVKRGYSGQWVDSDTYIEDKALYAELEEAQWDDNNDVVIDNVKYHRLSPESATKTSTADNYYNWKSDYAYFRYEPIKWRVLHVKDDEVFLVSDKALSCKKYDDEAEAESFEDSSLYSWLNGEFKDGAFNGSQKESVSGDISLLSEEEFIGSSSEIYGLTSNLKRKVKSSTYAKAMGTYSGVDENNAGCCYFWLKDKSGYATDGGGYASGQNLDKDFLGVRPVMSIKKDAAYCYAGKVTNSFAADTSGEIHQFDEGEKKNIKEASYTGAGSYDIVSHCSICGKVKVEHKTISKKTLSVPQAAAVLKTSDSIKVSWKKVSGATAYAVAYKKSDSVKWKKVYTTYLSRTFTDLTKGECYQFYVYAYAKKDGKVLNTSKSSDTLCVYTLSKPVFSSVKKSGTKVKLRWIKVKGADGYQISRSVKSNGKNIVSSVKATYQYRLISAKKGKTYYYRVRAYSIENGKRVYGSWSSAVKYVR